MTIRKTTKVFASILATTATRETRRITPRRCLTWALLSTAFVVGLPSLALRGSGFHWFTFLVIALHGGLAMFWWRRYMLVRKGVVLYEPVPEPLPPLLPMVAVSLLTLVVGLWSAISLAVLVSGFPRLNVLWTPGIIGTNAALWLFTTRCWKRVRAGARQPAPEPKWWVDGDS